MPAWTFMPLSNGGFTLLDAADYERVKDSTWSKARVGYAVCYAKGSGYLHRLILGLVRGDDRQADHRNRDKLDNRRANLRVVTRGQNRQNLSSYKGATSRHRGVCWDKQTGRWIASATIGGKHHKLGRFDSEEKAAAVVADFRAARMPFAEE